MKLQKTLLILSASSKAATTPMTPMGATLSTRNMLLNL